MAVRYPVKLLSDMDKKPFFPFVTSDAVFINGTDQTVADWLKDRYTKEEVNQMFEDLGTVMDFKGVVETEAELPNPGLEPGDVYLVLHYQESTITHGVIWDGTEWVDMGTPIDLGNYYVKDEVDELVSTSIAASEAKERDKTNNDIAASLNTAKSYTDTAKQSVLTTLQTDYYDKDDTDALVKGSITIPYYKGTSSNPIYLRELMEDYIMNEQYMFLLAGNTRRERGKDGNQEMVLPYSLYTVIPTSSSDGDYNYIAYRTKQSGYKMIFESYLFQAGNDYWTMESRIIDDSIFYTYMNVDAPWTFKSGAKINEVDDTDDTSAINVGYLNEHVIVPVQRLIARLEGEEV